MIGCGDTAKGDCLPRIGDECRAYGHEWSDFTLGCMRLDCEARRPASPSEVVQ